MVQGPRKLTKVVLGPALLLVLALALAAALLLPATAAAAAKARPVITSISPRQGGIAGGTIVTIRGKHFTAHGRSIVKAVRFGKIAGTKIRVRSSTRLTVRAPRAKKGTFAVRVTTKWGTSALAKADHFVYKSVPPVVRSLSPSTGSTLGGTRVTISGAGFTGATAVRFGGVAATSFTVSSDAAIVAVAPPQSAVGDPYAVIVSTPFGTSAAVAADEFNYYLPAGVTGVSPSNGPTTGETKVTITGNNLFAATAVRFGRVATTFSVKSDSTIVATAPSGSGTVDVTVTTPAGTSATSPIARYSYAAQIVASSATTQSQAAGDPVGTPPSVKATDALGNPVAGVSVTFKVASGGGAVTGATTVTDGSGIATLGSWTLGSVAGPNTLTATADSLTGSPVTFSATGLPGTPAEIVLVAGDGQSAIAGTAVAIAPSVKVTDAHGNNAVGVSITFAVASGGGSVSNGVVTTDSSGVATLGSWTLGPVAGITNTLTASGAGLAGSPVTFTAESTVGVAAIMTASAGNNQMGVAGSPVATPPAVTVTDAHGNPVSGLSVTFAVASGGGSVVGTPATTNASGVATVGDWTLGTAAGPDTLTATADSLTPVTFNATGTAGPATQMALIAGDGQGATVGTRVTTDPTVKVTDAHGNPVSGASVTFTVTAGGGSVTGSPVSTDSSGLASVGWTLGVTAGTNTLTATSGSLTPVTFNATGTAGAATQMALIAGDGQGATVGTRVTTDPTVKVTDAHGNPVSGASVTFTVTAGGGSVTGSPVSTDSSGLASVGWTLGATAGANTLKATSDSLSGSPVTFNATGTAGAATQMALIEGDQTGSPGSLATPDPTVLVTDAYGNPVSGVPVTFTVTAGNGSVTGSPVSTDSSGLASVGWTLGDPGTNTLMASNDSLSGSPVTFTATAA